jgi:hypothetical protein
VVCAVVIANLPTPDPYSGVLCHACATAIAADPAILSSRLQVLWQGRIEAGALPLGGRLFAASSRQREWLAGVMPGLTPERVSMEAIP